MRHFNIKKNKERIFLKNANYVERIGIKILEATEKKFLLNYSPLFQKIY